MISFSNVGGGLSTAQLKAYRKLIGAINEEAMLLVNLAERKQAMNMVVNSANRMLLAFQLLSRGRRASAMKALGLTPTGSKWSKAKDAGNIWLEWHFGWSPLLQDIHSAIGILQDDWEPKSLWSTGGADVEVVVPTSVGHWSTNMKLKVRVRMQATVRAANPMLWRANQLGLINPASVAWELIPFSFLVDWFIPVGEFLNSYTDFVGLSLENTFTTVLMTGTNSGVYLDDPFPRHAYAAEGMSMRRTAGIVYPVPRLRLPHGLSPQRGATAIALLLQAFAKGRFNRIDN
jgi:hypothetical protein